ncbi:hypothetical protein BOTBODRAFT_171313 [Botryobasidium botryosum FD-172 SS1]|uniref:Ribosomal protein S2 n=1 Tax=Botryobasidium botryosum (strain FD-172 SS1) TaxID=930990 RepID=A0A067N3Y4_BOTB1|nr:hypothetical protein BOTBODRAFT_171313 [Botryobasidium botryosum FD-172 SS1]
MSLRAAAAPSLKTAASAPRRALFSTSRSLFSEVAPETEPSAQSEFPTLSTKPLPRAVRKEIISHFTNLGSTQTRGNSFQPHHPLHRPASPHSLTLSALVASGAHIGHARALTRPSFIPYTYGHRAGVTIINLDHTLPLLRRAANVTRAIAQANGTVLFVGTTDALRPAVRKAAERMGPNGFHVGTKWLPGTLTNAVELFGPATIKSHSVKPDLVVFLNPAQNLHAIRECAIARIPTIGIIDSDVDPRIVMYPIPANDESIRTAELVAGVISIAGREGVEIWQRSVQEKAKADRRRDLNNEISEPQDQ